MSWKLFIRRPLTSRLGRVGDNSSSLSGAQCLPPEVAHSVLAEKFVKINPLSRILTPKLPVRSQWDFSSHAPNKLSCKICLLAPAGVPSRPLIPKKKLGKVGTVLCFGGTILWLKLALLLQNNTNTRVNLQKCPT